MKETSGDLIQLAAQGAFDVIIHGCNCQCQMGKGIALTIKNMFPEAYAADCKTEKGAREKLGTYSFAEVEKNGHRFTIVNAYTQFHWRGAGVKADYEAIRKVMSTVKQQFSGLRIGYPLIGAGLAGGDWDVIAQIIDQELDGEDHTLVRFTPA
ncbi:macro domain-containing protein [Zooshikella harenae]|uniref:Macro domain-containing protein n=1 Tax=Zooshikella harenae TaxID=2827238 RepID=A0ABS5ZK56_9GAMM|nr:macro domain-containing protein [Zooshikella harenae]MBU2714344.1 macro domain-containing protein [Zooshikella harenae]